MVCDKKICFIICSNQEDYLNECFYYLRSLEIPEGYEVQTLVITEAVTIASGYNEGMQASDAKYKIYLHQDTFIRNKAFLTEIVNIFQSDHTIGMIGMIGAKKLPDDGVMFREKRVGNFYRLNNMISEGANPNIAIIEEGLTEVEVIDGLMMITQYDLPWREDIVNGWDFYDVSQCLEFRKAGYKIVVPGQKEAWYIHDCGIPSFWNYEAARKKIVEAYPEYLGKKKRILYPYTDKIKSSDIPWALIEMGYDVSVSMEEVPIQDYSEREKDEFAERLKTGNYDYVITFDLSPVIAEACHEIGVKYIAWSYDSPLKELYGKYAKYPTNYIFVMDKIQKARLSGQGLKHLYYMPLATNMTRVQGLIISGEDENKLGCDISMVGSLYHTGFLEKMLEDCQENIGEEIQRFVYDCVGRWNDDVRVYEKLSSQAVAHMQERNDHLDAEEQYGMDNRFYYESLLAREITFRDRVSALTELAKEHEVFLYTVNPMPMPEKIHVMPKIDYQTETPKVFHLSKINLNITLRSIESGAPQRIFDIMSVGGFVMSNYQKELEELFIPDKEIVLFHTMDELKDKVNYYLKHEEERIRIAVAGYQKVKECYSYTKILGDIIKITDEN